MALDSVVEHTSAAAVEQASDSKRLVDQGSGRGVAGLVPGRDSVDAHLFAVDMGIPGPMVGCERQALGQERSGWSLDQ